MTGQPHCIVTMNQSAMIEQRVPMVMKWHRWELKEVEVNARKGGVFVREKRKKRVLVDHRGTIKEAIQSLIKDLEEPCQGTTLPMHLFVGNWQNQQFEEAKKACLHSDGTAVAIYDFSENFTSFHQDEIKSAHFGKGQITLHPVPIYFNKGQGVTRETIVIVVMTSYMISKLLMPSGDS